MKVEYYKIFFIFFLFVAFVNNSNAQFYFLEDAHDQIEIEFLRSKLEIETNKTFYNLVKIKNPSNQLLTFTTNFSYPSNWTFIGEKNQQISLAPNDSIYIPFRAAASIDAKGEIGYAIVASLSDLKGNTFKNEYSFVNLPKISDVKAQIKKRIIYFDKLQKATKIGILLSNSGNTDEIFYIDFNFPSGLTTPGESNGFFRKEIPLNSYSDSLITIPVDLNKKAIIDNRNFHQISIKTYTVDTVFKSSIWAKELENYYYNEIPPDYTMLGVELIIQNLFSEFTPIFNTNIYGNFLFKKSGAISYDFQTFGKFNKTDLWDKGRYEISYKYKGFNIKVGDLPIVIGHNLYGRGGMITTKLEQHKFEIISTKSVFTDLMHIAGTYQFQTQNKNSLKIGTSYESDKDKKVNSLIYIGAIGYGNETLGRFNITGAFSTASWYFSEKKQQIGYFGELSYFKNINKTNYTLNATYANREYFGYFSGRTFINMKLFHVFSETSNLDVTYSFYDHRPSNYFEDNLLPASINNKEEIKAILSNKIKPTTYLRYGLVSESQYSNSFASQNDFINSLKTRSGLGYISYSFNNVNTRTFFTTSLKAGYNFVTDYAIDTVEYLFKNTNWFSLIFTTNFRARNWGVSFNYYHGPYSINQQFSYFSQDYYIKALRLMPFIDYYLVPNFLKFETKPALSYNISAKTTRINLVTSLIAFPGKTWKLSLTNNYNFSANQDLITDEKFSYNSSYFEFRIQKDLNLNQPRYQYHDLKVYFFKDFNGNRVKDEEEPGLKEILFFIEKDEINDLNPTESSSSYFMSTDLLSDMDGIVEYKNIPNGAYILNYKPIGKIEGAYTSESSMQQIYINKNETLYIPFVENNKIFGKVILNRSKLSNLGSIDPSNIKVTAEDSYGKKYSSLTDANGNFNIFVPNVDKYKVHINNIFYENFELEQNDYEVQLNGYRQFEVNFIFNEKKRKINFAASYDYGSRLDGPGVEIVRRTNLAGTIKDATTLQPIVANIRVIDNQGNEVTSANSSSKTGVFTASFVAGDDYTVEVTSDDYWFYAEKLYSQQIVTFANLKKEILLKAITVGALIPMNTLNFESGKTEIPATSFPELERLLKVLKKNPTVKIAVHGHTDDLELKESQIDLATERAKLVAKYLIANGYNRVTYAGHANTKPIAENDTEDGRRMNRRVEIVVTGK